MPALIHALRHLHFEEEHFPAFLSSQSEMQQELQILHSAQLGEPGSPFVPTRPLQLSAHRDQFYLQCIHRQNFQTWPQDQSHRSLNLLQRHRNLQKKMNHFASTSRSQPPDSSQMHQSHHHRIRKGLLLHTLQWKQICET